ncbi:4'-phosphopantetheinyl transferase family protein [Ottowia thiooxydans]|uniref:4'-phosphopantetheinyl transferase n=1 Tax=Ottowia thiooxydans TaxID=219182 RepID=A0ABV2Q3E8_9BURK
MNSSKFCESQGAHVDLWLAYYGEFQNDDPALLELLNPAEREQQARFHFGDDRLRYLVTRAMVRKVLSRYADVAPKAWNFENNAYGRPEISGLHTQASGLRFNLSHTGGLIVLAVCRAFEMGVDVEHLDRKAALGVAERFFSPVEAAELASLGLELQSQRFFDYWTLKESYIKARGMGLSIPLDRFSFAFPTPETVSLRTDPVLGDDAGRWQFWQLRLPENYQLAICTEKPAKGVRALKFRRMATMDEFTPLEVQTLRMSV